MAVTGLVLFLSMMVSCIRNIIRQSTKISDKNLMFPSRRMTQPRPDSAFIQQLEEDMLSHLHTDLLLALQVNINVYSASY